MIQLQVIGNLGADAEVKETNGKRYVSFRVAHNEKSVDTSTGLVTERTIWTMCFYRYPDSKVVQFLKRGVKVYCSGEPQFRLYKYDGQFNIGISLSVDKLELCGGKTESPVTAKQEDEVETF